VQYCEPYSFLVAPANDVEVVAYRSEKNLQLHLIRHGATNQTLTLRLPESFAFGHSARVCSPDEGDSQSLEVIRTAIDATIEMPGDFPSYCVVEVPWE
jgi:hypothetical protein